MGGIVTQSFNIVTYATTGSGPLFIATSGTTLATGLNSYAVTVNSNVINSSLGLTCHKTTIVNTVSGGKVVQPIVGTYSGNISGTTSALVFVSGLPFNPGFVAAQAGNSAATTLLGNSHYTTYTNNSATLNFLSPVNIQSTVTINWVAYPQTG